jgi:DHA3 family macrolide efflux protein-like MFS transporter
MTETKPAGGGLRSFGLMWSGQLVSLVGSGLTRFALGVWVYQRTGSATQFTLITLFAFLPGLLAAPFAGALVDRWDRRWVMFWSDLAPALGTLALVLLIRAEALQVWHIYLVVAFGSVFNTFQWPAYIAATTLLVPKKQLGRANGMLQFGQAAAEVVAPILAGLMIAAIGLDGVILVDLGTFVFAAATLLLVRIPRPQTSAAGRKARGSLLSEAAYGWTFIRERPGLLNLLLYFAMVNLVFSIATVLVTPLVLSFASPRVLASVLSVSSAGLLTGSVVMAVTGGPRPRIHGVLAFGLLSGVALFAAGVRPNLLLISAALFLLMLGAPIVNGSSQAIWQVKVPPDLQGRVFAVRRLIAQFTAPLGFLSAGPLADHVFQPLLAEGGPLAGSVGRVLGVGPGRGIGLIYVTLAALPLLFSLWGYAQPSVRRVETDLPDAIRG